MKTPRANQLTEDDLYRLLGCIRELSNLENVNDFHTHAIKSLRSVVPDEWIASEAFDAQTFAYRAGLTDPIAPSDIMDIFYQRVQEHPTATWLCESGVQRGAVSWTDVLPGEKAYEALPIWQDVFRKLEIRNQVTAFEILPDGTLLAHNICRDAIHSPADALLMKMLRPHLTNAFVTWRRIKQADIEPFWLMDGLEAMGSALILIGPDAKPNRWTPHAQQLIDKYFAGVRREPGHLPHKLSRWIKSVLPEDAQHFMAPMPVDIPSPAGDAALHLQIVRQDSHNGYLLTLNECQGAPSPKQLQDRFGLPPKRAEVLHLLAKGMENRAIADEMGLKVATISKHLEYVYRSLRVSSRAEAVAKVAAAAKAY